MATAPVPDGSARLDAYVDGIVARLRREYGLPALTISVVRNDALLLAKGYGLADLASARTVVADTTLFRIPPCRFCSQQRIDRELEFR